MRLGRLQPLVALVGSWVTMAASACPDCPTSRVVRASVLGGDFWNQLVMLSVPFLLIGSLSALLYRVGLSRDGPGAGP